MLHFGFRKFPHFYLFPLAKLSRLAKSNIISNFFKIIIVIAGTRTRRTGFTLYYALAPIKILFVLVVVVAIVVVLFVDDIHIFNRDLNRGCLVYMFSLRFSGSKFLTNLRQFGVRKIFSYTRFCGIYSLFILCLKLLFRKCVTYVVGSSLIKTCSLTGC